MASRFPRLVSPATSLLCLGIACCASLFGQPRAILADGSGPWRDDSWAFAVSQFTGLLTDAGYSIQTVSPADLPSALGDPNIVLAVPSLVSLPIDTFTAIGAHVASGGALMASGGQPFFDPLYLAPDGQWLDAAAYRQATGSPPPQGALTPPRIPTVSPSNEQFTSSSGLRVPVPHLRGLFSRSGSQGRYRVIGDLSDPAATLYVNSNFASGVSPPTRSFIVWLPWPQLFDPFRAQLITALKGAPSRVTFQTAGADQMVWLPGEPITGGVSIDNGGGISVEATLQWSIVGASGVTPQPSMRLSLTAGQLLTAPIQMGVLPVGDYTLSFRLLIGNQEVDRADSPVRVLDPTASWQPDQKIRVVNGGFSAGGQQVFLRGVNYWPRLPAAYGRIWLAAGTYDPDVVEADLTEIAALGFNLVSIKYGDYGGFAADGRERALIDFLARCRNHGIWAQIFLPATILNGAYGGQISPTLNTYLPAAWLPGNDRVFAYQLLWEPMVGLHDSGGQGRVVNSMLVPNSGRLVLDADWRGWVNDQYGSLANAQQIWGFMPPLDSTGQLTNPLDDQMENDGPWRIMVAAYRRFLDDYLGRNLGAIARQMRRGDPDTLLTYRNWTTMTSTHNDSTGYDIGTAAAHLDVLEPERYAPALLWPEDQPYGLITAYSRYRSGGKPVLWAEYGADIGGNGTRASETTQGAICDTMMRQIADDGSNGAAVWWWPGGASAADGSDFGIVNLDGTPRACAKVLASWNATFAVAPPELTSNPSAPVVVDRDADARGSYGLFLNSQDAYTQVRQAGQTAVLGDSGSGTDTSSMPLIQVGNVPYSGTGPLKYANGELAGIHVVCPGLDVTVENGATVAVASGAVCEVTPTLVNTGEAQWLPASAGNGGVTLHTSAGDVPLAASLPSLQRTAMGPLTLTMGKSASALSGRLRIAGVGEFGEVINLTLSLDPTATGPCAISLSASGPISASGSGAAGTINLTTATGCYWTASASDSWVTVAPKSGSGSGVVSYTVLPNYGPARLTTILVDSRPITVAQDAAATPTLASAPVLSDASLSFGNQAIGRAGDAKTVTLTNTGTVAVNLSAITLGGTNGGDFSETNDCGPMVAGGASCNVQVIFTPLAKGTRSATLFIASNGSGGPSSVSLSGTGTQPALLPPFGQ